MTIDEKLKIKEDFEWWITSIPDKVLELQKELDFNLDRSLESLNNIEKHLIENFTEDFLSSEKGGLIYDQITSYIGSTIKLLVPNLHWHIEVEDKKNVFFGYPSLVSEKFPALCPHILVLSLIRKKQLGFISKKITSRI
ncbi:hypothetical protein [Crocinitomix catalasitica]|uniref:hypothetical protein n=1 Tax=Crocinitomix catalasitica TaxID=184607 RepID=UPI000483D82E|nr:hypothetical protein [Crocinitomix catalasitica]